MTETYEMCKTLIDDIINSIDSDVEKTIVKKQSRRKLKDIIRIMDMKIQALEYENSSLTKKYKEALFVIEDYETSQKHFESSIEFQESKINDLHHKLCIHKNLNDTLISKEKELKLTIEKMSKSKSTPKDTSTTKRGKRMTNIKILEWNGVENDEGNFVYEYSQLPHLALAYTLHIIKSIPDNHHKVNIEDAYYIKNRKPIGKKELQQELLNKIKDDKTALFKVSCIKLTNPYYEVNRDIEYTEFNCCALLKNGNRCKNKNEENKNMCRQHRKKTEALCEKYDTWKYEYGTECGFCSDSQEELDFKKAEFKRLKKQ